MDNRFPVLSRVAILRSELRCLRLYDRVGFTNVTTKTGLLVMSGDSSTRHFPLTMKRGFQINCAARKPGGIASSSTVSKQGYGPDAGEDLRAPKTWQATKTDSGDGGGNGNGNGKFPGSGGGGGGGYDGGDEDWEEEEFGPIMKFEEVLRETEARGATLPSDMLEAAKSVGLREVLLVRYLDLQGSGWALGFAIKSWPMLRNRMLADPSFLFKIGTEVQKRGKDFWAEFELFTADLLVGVVVNVALVGMLAPYARIGQPSLSKGSLAVIQRAYGALPSSVFEAERPGCKFSVKQRLATYFFKGILYGSVGFACGIVGQGIANLIMITKRSIKKTEEDIPVPPLVKSAALWGVFLAVSSNTRYQLVNGLERFVEASPLTKKIPPMALAFTVGVRFANNVYGGMQFVEWARWSGVQ